MCVYICVFKPITLRNSDRCVKIFKQTYDSSWSASETPEVRHHRTQANRATRYIPRRTVDLATRGFHQVTDNKVQSQQSHDCSHCWWFKPTLSFSLFINLFLHVFRLWGGGHLNSFTWLHCFTVTLDRNQQRKGTNGEPERQLQGIIKQNACYTNKLWCCFQFVSNYMVLTGLWD